MRYLLICLTFLMTLSPACWLQAQRPKLSDSDIPRSTKDKCIKMLGEARESMKDENNLEALKQLDRIIAFEPKFPWSYTNKVIALYRLDSLDECLKLSKESYDYYGNNLLSWLYTGKIYKGMKKYTEALNCFMESYKKNPKQHIGLYEWARLLVGYSRTQEAMDEISFRANYEKNNSDLWGLVAWLHLRANNLDSALYYADEGLSGKGSNNFAYYVMGEIYYAKSDLKKAIKYFDRVNFTKDDEFLDEEIYLQSVMTLASLRLQTGEYEDGVEELAEIKKFTARRRVAIPYLYLRICLDAMQNKNTEADVQKFKSLLTKDIGLEWDFSKTDAWLAKATLTPQQRTLIEDITKKFKEYVGKK